MFILDAAYVLKNPHIYIGCTSYEAGSEFVSEIRYLLPTCSLPAR